MSAGSFIAGGVAVYCLGKCLEADDGIRTESGEKKRWTEVAQQVEEFAEKAVRNPTAELERSLSAMGKKSSF